jgi:diphthine synthase
MLFLDIQSKPVERYMTVNEGATLLLEMQANAGERILDNTLGIGIARAGSLEASVKADLLPRLTGYDFGGPLHIIIIPAKLHFMEVEGLHILTDAPASALNGADRTG